MDNDRGNGVNNNDYSAFSIALIPLFFPFVGFFEGIDTQPIFLLLSLAMLPFYFSKIKLEQPVWIMFILIFLMLLARFSLETEFLDFKYVATYVSSILTFLIIYIGVVNGYFQIGIKFIIVVTVIYVGVGFVQLFLPEFLGGIVSRSVEHALSYSGSGRGVRSLTGEPAALGKVFTTLNVIFIYLLYSGKIKSKGSYAFGASFIFFTLSMLLSKSAYALGIHFVLLSILLLLINKRLFLIVLVFSIIIFSSFITYLYAYPELRAANVLVMLVENPTMLLQQGAMRRVFNIPITLNNLTYFGFAGAGNDPSTFMASVWTPFGSLNYMGFGRNIGGFVEFLLKFGVFSVVLLSCYFYMLTKIALIKYIDSQKAYRLGIFFSSSIFLLTFQDSSPVLPISWFLPVYFYFCRDSFSFNKS
jgi:hypothetical protein